MNLAWLAATLMATHGLSQIISVAIAHGRLRRGRQPPAVTEPITVIRPARGHDHAFDRTMGSTFRLQHDAGIRLVFCVDDEDDEAVPAIRQMIADHPDADAELLIGHDSISENPKLNNIMKGWRTARTDAIVIVDSNVVLPPDFIARQFAAWDANTAVVSQTAVGVEPKGFAAELECAFLNSLQARWLLAGDSVGLGFALGKSLMFRRSLVDRAGGIEVLAQEAAEDIAATKMAWRLGLRARLARMPLNHPVGRRRFRDVWQRQLRWARLRRVGVPRAYPSEIFLGGLLPIGYATALAIAGIIPGVAALAYAAAWYGLEAWLTYRAGWPLTAATPLAWIARDLLIPPLWIAGFLGRGFEWRGNAMTTSTIRTDKRLPR